MSFDYAKLLRAYINIVGENEGVDFLSDEPIPEERWTDDGFGLTREEYNELVRIAKLDRIKR